MSKPKLAAVQKRRMATASQEALSHRQRFHLAQITDAPAHQCVILEAAVLAADVQYAQMLERRGLCVGDTVRIVADGPYKDIVTEVRDIETRGRLQVRIDETTVLPWPVEVELVSALTVTAMHQTGIKARKGECP